MYNTCFSVILDKSFEFHRKSTKFEGFVKIEVYAIYLHQKRAKIIYRLIPRKNDMIHLKKFMEHLNFLFFDSKIIK